ncbi:VCBS repeat protein [Nocardioides sp. J9]|uniref:FG-GAP-like repeat-containing protein n=1 Tax=unclassified Nocardioides TaxID=2615069 RepID=UPI0004ADA3CD|nr:MULTISPECIES: FG-GAP-like repeat-containing protein [unclassified Nocardioides]TWH00719.1 VCBS repeat protein [Nocardioides sp. J9]
MSSNTPQAPEQGGRLRFVTLSQRLLALALVVAVLTPAARTLTMDVRPAEPGQGSVVPADVALRAAEVEVPTEPVEAEVEEFALTTAQGKAAGKAARTARSTPKGEQVVGSEVVPVEGYGTVGVTWAPGSDVAEDDIEVEVRTKTGGTWSDWTVAEYHDEHGPDPSTAEGRKARPGTDVLLVGEVDAVQVKVTTEGEAPADMKVAVIDPGKASATKKERPAIDTARLTTEDDGTATTDEPVEDPAPTGDGDLSMQAGSYTPKPQIYSRAQWGADERIRDKASLSYYEIHAGFVHHTVNANNYTAAQVPGIIRGIYNYHVKTRGWSDIGYNFLVDKFGRIWEGRAGGVDRPVVGAHTQGYNQYAFAMSAIGNFEVTRPNTAMIIAYGELFAWKLSLHGIDAGSTSQKVGSRTFKAINGHRDAGQTACPGRYLYEKLGAIRNRAKGFQKAWKGRELESNFAGSALPDLVARRKKDGRGVILPITNVEGKYRLGKAVDTGRSFSGLSKVWSVGDWDRDGKSDVIGQRKSDGALLLYRGRGSGKLTAPQVIRQNTGSWTMMAAVGDVTGDGYPDMMAVPGKGAMRILPGRALKGFGNSYPAHSAVPGSLHIGVGRWDKDGAPDSIVRDGSKLRVYVGNGPGGWTRSFQLPQSAAGYNAIVAKPSINGDWHTDLVARDGDGRFHLLRGTPDRIAAPIAMGRTTTYDLLG